MINVAVVGIGYWGPNMVRTFLRNSRVGKVYCCDAKPERLALIKKLFPHIIPVNDYKEILANDDIQAINLCTPPKTHYELARAALEHNKHILVEKPFTVTSEEAYKLKELGEKKGLVMMVGHTFLYSPPVMKVKEIVDSGELGNIYYVDSMRVNLGLFQKDVSVILDLAPHDVSILLYVLKKTPRSVLAIARDHLINGVNDVAYINLDFGDNLIAHIHNSWLSPVKVRRMAFSGSQKMLVYDDTQNMEKIKIYDSNATIKEDAELYSGFEVIYRMGNIFSPKVDNAEPIALEAEDFVSAILDGTTPKCNIDNAIEVVRVLEAAEKSYKTQKEVLLD